MVDPTPPPASQSTTSGLVLRPYDSPEHLMAPWFEMNRRQRREHYASRSTPRPPPTRPLITIVHNESVFLPIWLRYSCTSF